jgi:hypothetical protein
MEKLKASMMFNNLQNLWFWKRLVLASVFFYFIWLWYSGLMLQNIYDSPFQYKGADIAFWLLHWSHLPKLILYNGITSILFSFALIGFLLASFFFIEKRFLTVIAGVFLLLYQLLFNYKVGYHTHHLYGLHFALLPFYFKKENFYLSANFARIMVCVTYFFAGFFKLIGKGYLLLDSFSNTLQNQHSAYFYFHSDSLRSQFAFWMIRHPNIAWSFFFLAMLMQLSFILGLMSKRFDLLLFLFLLLFHVMDWFLMNLGIFMGMCIMSYLLLLPKSFFKDLNH